MRLNRPLTGFLIGLFLPMIGFLIVFLFLRDGQSLNTFIEAALSDKKAAALILSLSIIANAFPAMYLNSKKMEYGVRGIFVATMLYAVLIIWLKFVG